MTSLWKSLMLVSLTALLASCFGPPAPYGGRRPPGQRYSLDNPPPGGNPNLAADSRYVQNVPGQPPIPGGDIATPQLDPGLALDPNASTAPNPIDPATPGVGPTTDPAAPTETPITTPEPPKPQPPAELPYGKPVPGKRGFVYSPYDSSAGFVDVQGIAPGTKVRCPYTGKVFRVP